MRWHNTAVQSQNAVYPYFSSEQLVSYVFTKQHIFSNSDQYYAIGYVTLLRYMH